MSRKGIPIRTAVQTAARKAKRQTQRRRTPRVTPVTPSRLTTAQSALDTEFEVPEFDGRTAHTLALLLASGVPRDRAALYLLPTANAALRDRTFRAWCDDPKLLDAVNTLNGGEWHLLPKDARLQIAYDKTLAEMAYYLVTTKFDDEADGKTVAKLRECREAIRQAVAGADHEHGDALDAFMRYLADVVGGRATMALPPTLYDPALGAPLPTKES